MLFGDASDLSQIPVDKAEIIYDNNAKALEANKDLIDAAKVSFSSNSILSHCGISLTLGPVIS